jgi:hypothetical protein
MYLKRGDTEYKEKNQKCISDTDTTGIRRMRRAHRYKNIDRGFNG